MAVEPKEPSFSVVTANEAAVGDAKRLEDIAGQSAVSYGKDQPPLIHQRMRTLRLRQGIGRADLANTSVSAHADSVLYSTQRGSQAHVHPHLPTE
jgi:hypothetical protein